jgi:hypothetical protein
MRKTISVQFVKDGEVVGQGEALPGDKIKDIAAKAKVTLPESCMLKANEQDVQINSATARVPAPERRNLVDGEEDSEMMDSVGRSKRDHFSQCPPSPLFLEAFFVLNVLKMPRTCR